MLLPVQSSIPGNHFQLGEDRRKNLPPYRETALLPSNVLEGRTYRQFKQTLVRSCRSCSIANPMPILVHNQLNNCQINYHTFYNTKSLEPIKAFPQVNRTQSQHWKELIAIARVRSKLGKRTTKHTTEHFPKPDICSENRKLDPVAPSNNGVVNADPLCKSLITSRTGSRDLTTPSGQSKSRSLHPDTFLDQLLIWNTLSHPIQHLNLLTST